jgi:hypothetical protein
VPWPSTARFLRLIRYCAQPPPGRVVAFFHTLAPFVVGGWLRWYNLFTMARWAALSPVLLLLLAACSPDGAQSVTVLVDGETLSLSTEALTVGELLIETGISLDEDDRVEPPETTFVESGMVLRVVRVEVYTESEEHDIPFERRTVRDTSIPEGETRLLEAGVVGLEEWIYRVTVEDGTEIGRQLINRVTIEEAQAEVVLIGAQTELRPVPIAGTIAYVGNVNAWVMQTTSANRRRLTDTWDLDSRVFSLSADGSALLYTRAVTGTDLESALNTRWMVGTAAADAQPIELDVQGVLWADWAPECRGIPAGSGCRVAYTTGSRVEGNPDWKAANDLWVAVPRGSDGAMLAQWLVVEPSAGGVYGWWGTDYAWAPDGQRIAYARADQAGVIDLWNGSTDVLAVFAAYRTFAPWAWVPAVSWSPESQYVVTTMHGPSPTGETAEDSPVFDVWVLAADGSLAVELASETGMWSAPQYAAESEAIAFGRARSPYVSQTSGYDLYSMDRDGSDQQHLFPPREEIGLPYPHVAWGPGGSQLAVIYRGNLYLVDAGTGEYEQLTSEGGVTSVLWEW